MQLQQRLGHPLRLSEAGKSRSSPHFFRTLLELILNFTWRGIRPEASQYLRVLLKCVAQKDMSKSYYAIVAMA